MRKLFIATTLIALSGLISMGCSTKRRYYTVEGAATADGQVKELFIGVTVEGDIGSVGETDIFEVTLEKGVPYKIQMVGPDSLTLILTKPNGDIVAGAEGGLIEFTPDETGLYVLRITGSEGDTYTLLATIDFAKLFDSLKTPGPAGPQGPQGPPGADGADGSGIAAVLTNSTYRLKNHIDGTLRPPYYGLRLDKLFVKDEQSRFTFDFEAEGSDVRLSFDGTTIRIFGPVFGGWDAGGYYDEDCSGLHYIDFTFPVAQTVFGDDDLVILDPHSGSGTLTWKFGTEDEQVFNFQAVAGSDHVFRLGNLMDDTGYRRWDGISGWGDLDAGVEAPAYWLFVVVPLD